MSDESARALPSARGNGGRDAPAESYRELLPSTCFRSRSHRGHCNESAHANVSSATLFPNDVVAKYQVTKVSWRGKYERILAIAPTCFCTMDPKDCEVTNTWPLSALLTVRLDALDVQSFALVLRGAKKDEQLKLRCRFRSKLLSDLYQVKEQCQLLDVRPDTGFECTKWLRDGNTRSCELRVGSSGVTVVHSDVVRSTYLYTEMEHLTLLTDPEDGLAIGYTGRSRLFFSPARRQLYHCIQTAAQAIGCGIQTKEKATAEQIQEERTGYGLNHGRPCVQFHVMKRTPKHSNLCARILSLHEKVFLELDQKGKVVACYNYSDVYVLVRNATSAEQFEIHFCNDQVRTYVTKDRDDVLSAFYDMCVTYEESPELVITSVGNQRGLRLLPVSAVEDTTESLSFFNDTSIGSWYLQRFGSVKKIGNSLRVDDRGFVDSVAEFNANVPPSGIPYNTKNVVISDALRPMCAKLYCVAKTKPVPERSATILLQALFRISSSYYGFREVGRADRISEMITNLLINGDEFVVLWTTLLLRRMMTHISVTSANFDPSLLGDCEEIETYNKKVLLANPNLARSLIDSLECINADSSGENTYLRSKLGPLAMMGLLQALEVCLCSRACTTGSAEFASLVKGVARCYNTLLKELCQSRCATTVEACTMLLKTTLEECGPDKSSGIRNKALTEGMVLEHFYQALFDQSFDQRCVSRYMVSILMSHHAASEQLLSRMIPSGLFRLLKEAPDTLDQVVDYDRLEREAMETERQGRLPVYNCDGCVSPTGGLTCQNGSNDRLTVGEVSTVADSDAREEMISPKTAPVDDQNSAHQGMLLSSAIGSPVPKARVSPPVELILITEVRDNERPVEIGLSKARTLRKLKGSVDNTGLRSAMKTRDESSSRISGFHDPALRSRKRDVALIFLDTLRGKRVPSFNGHKPVKEEHFAVSRSACALDNYRLLFHMMSLNHETVDIIWNSKTREALQKSLYAAIQSFTRFRHTVGGVKARWNYEDFSVSYPSLAHEVVVAGCYIRILANLTEKMSFSKTATDEDGFTTLTPEQTCVREPAVVLGALYVRMLRERVLAEYRNDLDTSILCIKSMGVVAAAHAGYENAMGSEEAEHLWTVMSETVHASVLESILHTMRALCQHPENARQVLRNNRNLEMTFQLLHSVHAIDRGTADIVEPRRLWVLETDGGEVLGSFSVNELKQKRDEGYDLNSYWVKRRDEPSCEALINRVKVMEIAQLRWEVGISGELHPLQMAHDAISILLSVARCNSLHCDNNYHCSDSMSPIFPRSLGQTMLWKFVRKIIPVLVRSNHLQLWEKAVSLLGFLYSDCQRIIEIEEDTTNRGSLFSWGLFYLAFTVEASNFSAMAGLLKATHLRQNGFNGTSALSGILPQGMINLLEDCTSSEFTNVFCEGQQSPQVIWTADMRKHLRTVCRTHLQDYADILEEDASREWRFCAMAPTVFRELSNELLCGGLYLGQFCEIETYTVSDPLDFTDQLMKEWRAEASRREIALTLAQAQQTLGVTDLKNCDATLRAGFKKKTRALKESDNGYAERLDQLREAYRVLTCPRLTLLSAGHDPCNLQLLLHSLVIMCKHYPECLVDYEFDAYDLLLPLLASHCSADGVPPIGTTEGQTLKISVCAAELIFNTCAISAINWELLLEHSELSTLEKVVNFCVDSVVGCETAVNPELLKVCLLIFQTITGLLAFPRGRGWIAESSTLVVDMVRILWVWNHAGQKSYMLAKLTQQVLEGISRMTELEKNQTRLVQCGILWQLFKLFSTYDIELDDAIVHARLQESFIYEEEGFTAVALEVQNMLAVMSVRALCRLGGLFAEDKGLQTPLNLLVKRATDALMTPNLSQLLLLSSHHEFLKIFHGECESYTLFWNRDMRQEQMKFVSPRAILEPRVCTDENCIEAIEFRFVYLADLLYVGGMYVKMLIGSMQVIEKSSVPVLLDDLGLTATFFEELFSFVHNGELTCPQLVTEEGAVLNLPPYAGWSIDKERRTTADRVTALKCLSVTASVAPVLVEKSLIANNTAMKMLMRLLFPPDNEVHQSEDAKKCLAPNPLLYVPCRLHWMATLQVLSTLLDFGTVSLEFGICHILIELVHVCQDVGPEALGIIRNLCANGAGAKCARKILQSGIYLEIIGWLLLVKETVIDEDFDAAERLRIPSAMILSEMVKDGAPLNIESRHALCRFFPPAIVRVIASSPEMIVEYILADHMTPELVWNVDFRNHQRNSIGDFLDIYFSSISTTQTGDGEFLSVVDSFEIDYSLIYPALMAGNVYLTLFMEDPTFSLYDPFYFLMCLWSEFEILFRQLAHVTSALRATMARVDDEMVQRDVDAIDLVGSSLVCLLQVETSTLDKMVELQIFAKCCNYLNDTVRSEACEPCVINVVRIVRVCSMSRACIASVQPMCSTLLSCLMAIANPVRGGPLHYESAFVLEIVRQIILKYPEHGDRDASAGIVYLASRLNLFGFLFNILDIPGGIGNVKEPHIVRAEAIEILNMLEKDRVQATTAHQILKKHKKWQKSYQHEATDVITSMYIEDPFMQTLYPKADHIMREFTRAQTRQR